MMKRNDGYALAYVLVVMLILAAIAVAVMTMSLQVLKNQQTSITRMQDKYAAQGLVEQVVAQLEDAETDDAVANVVAVYAPKDDGTSVNPSCTVENGTYTIVATSNNTTVTAEFTLTERTQDVVVGEGNSATTEEKTIGHTVVYTSYKTERISTEVNEG